MTCFGFLRELLVFVSFITFLVSENASTRSIASDSLVYKTTDASLELQGETVTDDSSSDISSVKSFASVGAF